MAKGKSAPAPAVTEAKLTDQKRMEKFQAEYIALCKKHGLTHVFRPEWKQSMDTGVYSLIIQSIVMPYRSQPAE